MVQFRRTQLPMHLVLKTLLKHVKRLKSFVYGSSRLLVGNRDPDAGQGKLPTRLLALPEAAPRARTLSERQFQFVPLGYPDVLSLRAATRCARAEAGIMV